MSLTPLNIKSVTEADVRGKRVLVRVDFNVPLEEASGQIRVVDDMRIKAALPTITYLHEQGAAKILLVTHVGRPEGKIVENLRVKPLLDIVHTLANYPEVEMLENVRFDPREEANDEAFAKELAAHGDIYVNEAFPVSHRADASIVGIPKFLPSYAGLRFIEEVEHITPALTPPVDSVAIIGGAKFETKEPLLEKLLKLYGTVLLGGVLANDMLKSRGMPIGVSHVSPIAVPQELAENEHIQQPLDLVVASATMSRPANTGDVRKDERIVDIGAKTAEHWADQIRRAPFVLWNGPTGVYEEGFTMGTDALAQALATTGARAVVGGGDTVAAIHKFTFEPARVFISTGGGAMLQFLADGTLPGIEALKKTTQE
jgi:phosphoglycerate kinase